MKIDEYDLWIDVNVMAYADPGDDWLLDDEGFVRDGYDYVDGGGDA